MKPFDGVGKFFQLIASPREGEEISNYFLRVDARLKICYVTLYWFLFGLAALLLHANWIFHPINAAVAAFFYLYARRNMRGDKYYSIHFDFCSWLHLLTMNFVLNAYVPELPPGTFWDRFGPVLAMFVVFFSLSRYKDYCDAKYIKQIDREIDEYNQGLARMRAARGIKEQ